MSRITINLPRLPYTHKCYSQENRYWEELQMDVNLNVGADISISCDTMGDMAAGTDDDVIVHEPWKTAKKARAWSKNDAWFQMDSLEDSIDMLILQLDAGKISKEDFSERVKKLRDQIRQIKQQYKL